MNNSDEAMMTMESYKPRKVEFCQIASVNDWQVKVYTITSRASFESKTTLENAVTRLPVWLEKSTRLNLPTYKAAFLIVHEGRDGIWSLINWWIGGGRLQSTTFYTSFEQPNDFTLLPTEGFMACVWEIPIISFERTLWVEHILKRAEKPDFSGYLAKHLSREI